MINHFQHSMDSISLPQHIKENIMDYFHPYQTIWNNVMNSLIFFHKKKNLSYLWYKLMNDLSYYHKDRKYKSYLKYKEDDKWMNIIKYF